MNHTSERLVGIALSLLIVVSLFVAVGEGIDWWWVRQVGVEHAAFQEGRQAFRDGAPREACPYGVSYIGADRKARWKAGWKSAEFEDYCEKINGPAK